MATTTRRTTPWSKESGKGLRLQDVSGPTGLQ